MNLLLSFRFAQVRRQPAELEEHQREDAAQQAERHKSSQQSGDDARNLTALQSADDRRQHEGQQGGQHHRHENDARKIQGRDDKKQADRGHKRQQLIGRRRRSWHRFISFDSKGEPLRDYSGLERKTAGRLLRRPAVWLKSMDFLKWRPLRLDRRHSPTAAKAAENERHDHQNEKHDEQNPGDVTGGASHTGKTKRTRDQSDHQEDNSPAQHDRNPPILA